MLKMYKRGIRFFHTIRFQNTNVKRCHEKYTFLQHLRNNSQISENVLIIAHGAKHAILTTTHNPANQYEVYIASDDCDAFCNDFVFAISCLTASEFGQSCIDSGAIAYLGYQVEIGNLFNPGISDNNLIPKRIRISVSTIIKRIFVSELAECFEHFLLNPVSVEVLKERFSFALEKKISELTETSLEEIQSKYNIKIYERHYKQYFVTLVLETLALIENINSKLICIGDSQFISPTFVSAYYRAGMDKDTIISSLEKNLLFQKLDERYKTIIQQRIEDGSNV